MTTSQRQLKVMHLPTITDIGTCLLPAAALNPSADTEAIASAFCGGLGPTGLSVAALCTVRVIASSKPKYTSDSRFADRDLDDTGPSKNHPKRKKKQKEIRADICKELLPRGVIAMWAAVIKWRIERKLPVEGLCFVDLSSGIGGVVLAMHIIAAKNVTSIIGVKESKYVCGKFLQWVDDICESLPWVRHSMLELRENIMMGDMLADPSADDAIQRASVIFSNNYLFYVVKRTGSLNSLMAATLVKNMAHDACIVTTAPIAHSSLQLTAQFAFPAGSFSWTHEDESRWQGYIYSKIESDSSKRVSGRDHGCRDYQLQL
jgi:hypothetical protein